MTYGVCSSAFLSTRCLVQIALENKESHPEASRIIRTDFYVDDLLSGSDTIEGARALKSELMEILAGYGFELRKWTANDIGILQKSKFDETDNYHILESETKKTLGVWWQAKSDLFKYKIDIPNNSSDAITKRQILSSISRLFDPLGILAPVIVQAKILLQRLWQYKIGWDDPLPQEITTTWLRFSRQLPEIENIAIPRHVLSHEVVRIELHGFCDSSESAYGACIYIKSVNSHNEAKIQLLCSKSRVAPLKSVSLPRLELCGAVLLANLYKRVLEAIHLEFNAIHFWTDSSIVLSWLRAPPTTWKVFIANRVSEIQSLTDVSQWAHVSSGDNPADLVTRGVSPESLTNNELWWRGPRWLSLDTPLWPKSKIDDSHNIPEKRKARAITLPAAFKDFSIFEKYSSLYRLKRVVALCFRFCNNCRSIATNRRFGLLSLNELNFAFNALIRLAQAEAFADEL